MEHILAYLTELINTTFDNWSNLGTLCAVFIFPFIIKIIKRYKAKNDLELYISKEEIKELKYFVDTCGQHTDPCKEDEIKFGINENRYKLIPNIIEKINKNMCGRYYIVLADSGMGKTTFLRMLYIKYSQKILKKGRRMVYFPLSNNKDLNEIKNIDIKTKRKTVLLLDSLDEDINAINNYHKRYKELIEAIDGYSKVIITCRTQFFLNSTEEPVTTNQIEESTKQKTRQFIKIYLSPFSDVDINYYLRKKYKHNYGSILEAKTIINKCPNLMARPMLLGMLDELIDAELSMPNNITDIYDIIIENWIERESNDKISKESLREFTKKCALYMLSHNNLYINREEICELCLNDELEVLNPIFARSKSLLNRLPNGNYKFAHRSIYEYLVSKYALTDKTVAKRVCENIVNNGLNSIYYRELCALNVEKMGDYSYRYLDDLKLNHLDLVKADFSYSKLLGSNLSGSNLTGGDFTGSDLSKANLTGTNLSGANLTGTVLIGADLSEAIISKANLKNANLRKANLTGVNFSGTEKYITNLAGANLSGANLSGVDLKYVDLTCADLSKADLSYAKLFGINLVDIDLSETNLTEADLSMLNLIRVNLSGANLIKVKLSYVNILDVDLTGAELDSSTIKYFENKFSEAELIQMNVRIFSEVQKNFVPYKVYKIFLKFEIGIQQ